MAVRIRSLLVSGPLMVPLSGGGSVRLSPGEVTGELPDVEVMDNAKVDKLRERRLIHVEQVDGDQDQAEGEPPEPDPESAADEAPGPEAEKQPASAPRRGTRSRQD
jgi:hypothetical protein